jgi:hypothetical protein
VPSAGTVRLCESLWERAGEVEPFPRDLNGLYTWALPLFRIIVPALSVTQVRRWLEERGLDAATGPQRRLRACLIARSGCGFVFVDGADPPDERRFSLAHEAGHFLLDYQQPRERLAPRLGASALDAFDGGRAPAWQERVDAALGGVELQPHLHLMERDSTGLACGAAAGAECLADELALELLAPEIAVLDRLRALPESLTYRQREQALDSHLRSDFGLPEHVAGPYAMRLLRREFGGPSSAEWLGVRPFAEGNELGVSAHTLGGRARLGPRPHPDPLPPGRGNSHDLRPTACNFHKGHGMTGEADG